jgi:hypothetical protein
MKTEKWISAWCSIIGSSHILEGLPCQDSSKVEYILDSDFVIAVISDGAGSCANSQIGSAFLVDRAIEKMATTFKLNDWFQNFDLDLNQEKWRNEAFILFTELKEELKLKAVELEFDFKSLSATLIIAVSNGNFIACANVGDGRAAFRNLESKWFPMVIPTKGEEANQTLFITSDLWDNNIDSEYFGSYFYSNPITAFTLLSDGCERASFEILKYNEKEDKYFDPNKPFEPFFEPNYLNLLKLKEANVDQMKINELWGAFIEKGNPKLISETDDKSMILSVFFADQTDEAKG